MVSKIDKYKFNNGVILSMFIELSHTSFKNKASRK